MITRKSIDEVLERARIDEVVQDFVNLRRRGSNLIGLCPFHHEKTPSFNVSPSRNIFKCFGCGKGGDSVRFVMEHEAYDFPEAIRYLAAKYNIPLEETKPDAETLQAEKERETLYKVLEFAGNFYIRQLKQEEEGQDAGLRYLEERGFRPKTIEAFGLGYAPQRFDGLVTEATKAGYSVELLRKAGLMTEKGNDFFRQRVMFPIHNISGKIIAFGGRQLINQKNSPKYLNSPETEIYNKRKVLYGIFQAKKAIRDKDNCFLVEGYTDVISLHQAGVENVVASSGTALTPDQIRLIRRYTNRVTVLYDSDPAGIKAALRGLDLILEENMDVQLALLPEGEDPDSFVKKSGLSGFEDYIAKNAKDFILFKTSLLQSEAGNDPIRRTALIKDLVQSLAHIPEAIKRSTFITEVAHQLRMDEHILVRETNKAVDEFLRQRKLGIPPDVLAAEREDRDRQIERATQNPDVRVVPMPDAMTEHYQERDIVRILVNYGHKPLRDDPGTALATHMLESMSDVLDSFTEEIYRTIIQDYVSEAKQGRVPGIEHFVKHPERRIRDLAIELLSQPYEYARWEEHDMPLQIQRHPDDNYEADAFHAILRLKLRIIMDHIRENQHAIDQLQASGQDDELAIHVRMHYELIQMREQITGHFKNVVLKA